MYFFTFQARATSALSTREGSVSALKNCWEILKCESISFVTLVTGAFPPPKVINSKVIKILKFVKAKLDKKKRNFYDFFVVKERENCIKTNLFALGSRQFDARVEIPPLFRRFRIQWSQ